MNYSIKWNPNTSKKLNKFPKEVAERVIRKLESLKTEPFQYLEHYEGEKVYKLRIDDYRALIDVDFSNKILKVRVVDHRKRIYKRGF